MADDTPLKSAYELALERLRRKDADEGVERRQLTADEKAAIAEARNVCEARLAERDVLHHSKLRTVADPAARDALEAEYRRDRERLIAERDGKIEKIHKGAG